ncbi:MAG: hypothetical protein WCV50_06870 [Patescibacteria group bacterium]|jgi:hypothetical protein
MLTKSTKSFNIYCYSKKEKLLLDSEKPIGTFRCVVCQSLWDGSQLMASSRSYGFRCGNPFCGACVRKISDKPKAEYEKDLK